MEKRRIKFILFVLLILVLVLGAWYFNVYNLLKIENLRNSVSGQFAWLIYILIYLLVILLLVPSTPIIIAGGILFGTFWALVYIVIASIIGDTITFFISRILGRDYMQKILKTEKLENYDKKIKENGFLSLFILRIIPIMPDSVLNYGFGLTDISFKDYFIATAIGVIPVAFVLAYFGDSIAGLSMINIVISAVLFGALLFVIKYAKGWFK